MIKRLQTDISGQNVQGPNKFRAPPLTYGGYFAGISGIKSLPPNALLSNKFIQPTGPTVVEVEFGGYIESVSSVTFPSTTTVMLHFNGVFSIIDCNTIQIQIPDYNFTGATLIITDPTGYTITTTTPTTGACNFIFNTITTEIPSWSVTFSGSTPFNTIDYINFSIS